MTDETHKKLEIVSTVSQIFVNLFLTGFLGAIAFRDNNPDCVVVTVMHEKVEGIEYHEDDTYIHAYDGEGNLLIDHFDAVHEKISALELQGRPIVFHCHQGISRSATMLIAYLMKRNQWTFRRAATEVSKKRRIVCPKPCFFGQLMQYEKQLISAGYILE
jgi:protein-tyrosine phosphatase